MQSEAKPRPQTCSSFEYAENTTAVESKPLLAWGGGRRCCGDPGKESRQEGTLHLIVLSVKNDLLNHFCDRF